MFRLHMIRERALISCYIITLITRIFDSSMNPEFMSLYQPHSFSFITTFITSRLHLAMFPLQMVIQWVLPSSNKITLWAGKYLILSWRRRDSFKVNFFPHDLHSNLSPLCLAITCLFRLPFWVATYSQSSHRNCLMKRFNMTNRCVPPCQTHPQIYFRKQECCSCLDTNSGFQHFPSFW